MGMKKVTVSMELTSSPSDFFILINALLLLFFDVAKRLSTGNFFLNRKLFFYSVKIS